MLGPLNDEQIQQRRINLAVREALTQVTNGAVTAQQALQTGATAKVIQNGSYDEDGNWQGYLRCDAQGCEEAGCAP